VSTIYYFYFVLAFEYPFTFRAIARPNSRNAAEAVCDQVLSVCSTKRERD
jgi:hypothetical protein